MNLTMNRLFLPDALSSLLLVFLSDYTMLPAKLDIYLDLFHGINSNYRNLKLNNDFHVQIMAIFVKELGTIENLRRPIYSTYQFVRSYSTST